MSAEYLLCKKSRTMLVKIWLTYIALSLVITMGSCGSKGDDHDAEDFDPYTSTDPKLREPSPCEVCKIFITELQTRLDASAKSKEVIETGHGLEKKKRFEYRTAELRLVEALLEPHVCDEVLKYNVHAEREGSLRYAKGQSETMSTLHGLVNKGVKVELGIPYEMWDNPSAEISKMHRACFHLAEYHEEDIEDWYYNHQDNENLLMYLCANKYLPRFPEGSFNKDCLKEVFTGKKGEDDEQSNEEPAKKKKKKKAGSKEDNKAEDAITPQTDKHTEL